MEIVSFLILHICIYIYGMVWYGIYGIYTLFILQKDKNKSKKDPETWCLPERLWGETDEVWWVVL